jgi:deoxyribodipyrimidine photo-lyase
MRSDPAIVWFRRDLRLSDNPALIAAFARGGPVIPVFVWAPEEDRPWQPGAAARWWLHHSLDCLSRELASRGSRLVIRKGLSFEALLELVRETGARGLFWNRVYEPAASRRDRRLEHRFEALGLKVGTFNASLLFEPAGVRNKQGRPFQVFTPFWRSCTEQAVFDPPAPAMRRLLGPRRWPKSANLSELKLLPTVNRAAGFQSAWTPGERGAQSALRRFLKSGLDRYVESRDTPALDLTSRLSPHLHFGEIGPRQIWHAVSESGAEGVGGAYLRQLGWREFAHHLLFHFPHTPTEPLRPEYAAFPWRKDPRSLRAWQAGRTGYPLVDAGIRQLWQTGWMHNRVRMIVASFLVKDLLLPWQDGSKWFWDTLVDADLANNTMGWQWAAGCGADAAPYFRVFNPVLQGEKFDPKGAYVRHWVPELARLPGRWIHKPWAAPAKVLTEAGMALGRTYPRPIVDHAAARNRALEAFGWI